MFERSEFGAPRLNRAPQGIRPSGPDGGLGDSVFAYFYAQKVRRISQRSWRRDAFDFEFKKTGNNNSISLAQQAVQLLLTS